MSSPNRPARVPLLLLGGVWCVLALAWGGLLLYLDTRGTRVGNLLRDPVEVGNLRFFAGMFSTLGIMMWSFAVGASLLAAWVLFSQLGGQAGIYPLATGLLALLLTVDDAFLIHESAAPNRMAIPENVVLSSYAAAAVAWVVAFFRRWDAPARLLVGLAAITFGLSLGFVFLTGSRPIVEDGFKYLGLFTFSVFCLREAARVFLPAPHGGNHLTAPADRSP
ncbi:MAG: hypothetical protein ACRDJL_10020 [Actinomycetota bacterium]